MTGFWVAASSDSNHHVYSSEVEPECTFIVNATTSPKPSRAKHIASAAENEGDLDSLPDGNYRARTLEESERNHYSDLKDRYRQRRDCIRQLVAQLSTLNSRKKLN